MRHRTVLGLIGAAAVGMTAWSAVEPPAEPATPVAQFMRKKLDHAQKILEGITLAEPELVERHAEALLATAKTASWLVVKTPEYEQHSSDFRRQLAEMVKAARAKNIDAATLNYVEMTLTCVKCHKYVRDTKVVSR